MTVRKAFLGALALGCAMATPTANAASISLAPVSRTVAAGTQSTTFELMMNFSVAETTVGGSIDIDVFGAGDFLGFAPSSYMTTVADPAFTGMGTARADKDYEIHFGSFGGLSGTNILGMLTVSLSGVAGSVTTIALAPNSFWGGFFSATSAAPINATMTGATVTVAPVPEPHAAWLLLAGLGGIAAARRRRR